MIRRLSIFFLVLIAFISGFAQSRRQGTFFIRTNPLSLIELQAGPVIGVEYFVAKDFSVGVDVGYIFYNAFGDSTTYHPKGFRIKPEIRYYLPRAEKRKTRFFVAAEGIFLTTTTDLYDELSVLDNMGNVAYTYLGGYQKIKKTSGGSVKFGLQMPFIPKRSKHFFVEFYLGVGMKNKVYSYKGVPSGASVPVRTSWINLDPDDETKRTVPTMPAGLKLLWKL